MTRLHFIVDGHAIPKKRPRVTRRGTFMPTEYVEWKERIAEEAAVACAELADRGEPWPADAPAFRLVVKCAFPGAVHGDTDGLVGSVMDALNGLVWKDDKLVVDQRGIKFQGEPRCEVEVTALDSSPMAQPKSKRKKTR